MVWPGGVCSGTARCIERSGAAARLPYPGRMPLLAVQRTQDTVTVSLSQIDWKERQVLYPDESRTWSRVRMTITPANLHLMVLTQLPIAAAIPANKHTHFGYIIELYEPVFLFQSLFCCVIDSHTHTYIYIGPQHVNILKLFDYAIVDDMCDYNRLCL